LAGVRPLPDAGQATAVGSLVFLSNAQFGTALSGTGVFVANANPQNGNINTTTTYGDLSEPASYVDSGSNGWFFNDALAACTGGNTGFYCPASTTPLSATMQGYASPTPPTFTYSFNIASAAALSGSFAAFNDLGGPNSTCDNTLTPCTFDWGLPFFFGRSVYTALEGTTIGGGGSSPFVAATTP